MKKLLAGLAAITTTALAVPALAGGYNAPVVEAPVAAPVAAPVVTSPDGDWTGGYVAGQLGWGHTKWGGASDDTAVYGLRGGYDYDFGKFVLGANLDWNKVDGDLGAGNGKLKDIARLGVRAGYDMGRTLVYVAAGGARANFDTPTGSTDENGYYAGFGVDYAINDKWTVGGEVLQNRFTDFNGTNDTLSTTTAGLNVGFRF